MDLRIQKTEQSIRSAFIALLKTKPLEKITVKELTETATINKGTFYRHYRDILSLADTMENELMEEAVSVITEQSLLSPKQIVFDLAALYSQVGERFILLFPSNRINGAVEKLETMVKKKIFEMRPFLAEDETFAIRLTATIYGCFYAYVVHAEKDQQQLVPCLAQYAQDTMDLKLWHKEGDEPHVCV